MTTIEVGDPAPDFTLKGPGGEPVTLSDYRGRKNVILVFFAMAFSPVCATQLPEVQEGFRRFDDLDAVVLGVSVDNHYANSAFAERLRLSFPLLSDFKREASAAFGVLSERGHSGRALFVIDKTGRVVYKDISSNPGDPAQIPSPARAAAALEGREA